MEQNNAQRWRKGMGMDQNNETKMEQNNAQRFAISMTVTANCDPNIWNAGNIIAYNEKNIRKLSRIMHKESKKGNG